MLHHFSVMRFENLLQQIFRILCGNLNYFLLCVKQPFKYPLCFFSNLLLSWKPKK